MDNKHIGFSETGVWQGLKDFYCEEGVGAWEYKVPFYITSNPYIAASYASSIASFIDEHKVKDGYQSSEPFYILELGAGTGKFSFYMIKKLKELQEKQAFSNARFVYVISDFSEKNLEFIRGHEAMQPFIEKGLVDFCFF